MQREIVAHFSHKAGEATIVRALQQLKMRKFADAEFFDNSRKNIKKIACV